MKKTHKFRVKLGKRSKSYDLRIKTVPPESFVHARRRSHSLTFPIHFPEVHIPMKKIKRNGHYSFVGDVDNPIGADLTNYEKQATRKIIDQVQQHLMNSAARLCRNKKVDSLEVSVEMETNLKPGSNGGYRSPLVTGRSRSGRKLGDTVTRYHEG